MTDKVMVRPVRPYDAHDGSRKHPGDEPYAVDALHAQELEAFGLAEAVTDEAPAAKAPAKAPKAAG